MKTSLKLMIGLSFCISTLAAQAGNAQFSVGVGVGYERGDRLGRGELLEQRLQYLEDRIRQVESNAMNLNQRLIEVENKVLRIPGYPGFPGNGGGGIGPREVSCMLQDTGYSKVFLGKGRTQLEAEANVRNLCGQSVHSSYCVGSMKCSDSINERPINGAICVLIDSGYSKTFRGEAKSLLEAEYNARKACGSNVHASYCVGAIRCESF